jgi:hypothetical protein
VDRFAGVRSERQRYLHLGEMMDVRVWDSISKEWREMIAVRDDMIELGSKRGGMVFLFHHNGVCATWPEKRIVQRDLDVILQNWEAVK